MITKGSLQYTFNSIFSNNKQVTEDNDLFRSSRYSYKCNVEPILQLRVQIYEYSLCKTTHRDQQCKMTETLISQRTKRNYFSFNSNFNFNQFQFLIWISRYTIKPYVSASRLFSLKACKGYFSWSHWTRFASSLSYLLALLILFECTPHPQDIQPALTTVAVPNTSTATLELLKLEAAMLSLFFSTQIEKTALKRLRYFVTM